MIYPSLWKIPVFIPTNLRPIAQIRIFQISKMLLIKISQLFHQFLPIDCRASTGRKNPAFFLIPFLRLPFSPSKRPSQSIIKVSGVIHQLPLLKLKHQSRAGKSIFLRPDSVIQRLKKFCFRLRIVIQKHHIFPPGLPDSHIDSSAKSRILRKTDQPHPGKSLPDISHTSIFRTVIHKNRFKLLKTLPF